jgi:hypothetical protein
MEIPSVSPSPLVAPKSCPPTETELEIEAQATTWVTSRGRAIVPGKLCLAAPSDEAFTITLHNDPRSESAAFSADHNVSLYADSTATESLFTGDEVSFGESETYRLPPLSAGLYFLRCDVHPDDMTGVLVVE